LKPIQPRKKRIPIDPERPEPKVIAKAAGVLLKGGVIVFPTRSLYGLGVDAFNEKAVQSLFSIKGRPPEKPILVLIHDVTQLDSLVREVPVRAQLLMRVFWPGKLTLVFDAAKRVPEGLTAGTGKIGIRQAGHPAAAALAAAFGRPITGTSANRSGRPGVARISDLDPLIGDAVDLILDAGPLEGGAGSTVLDVTCDPPRLLRKGDISGLKISQALDFIPLNMP